MLQMTCSMSICSWNSPCILPQRLSTTMLQMTDVILYFHGICSMQFTKTRPYHNATNNTRRLIFSIFFPWLSQKTARYHDATKNTRHLIFLRYLPWKSPNRLSTMMRQMKDFICIFHVFPTKLIKTAQYHDATNDVPHLNVFTVFCIKSGKAARYHDATNDARHLKFSCFFSMRSSKHIRTVAIQITHVL